jgi:transcription elongation factor GreA
MQRFKVTRSGYDKLKTNLDHLLQQERPSITKAIEEARALGDLSENTEYSASKERQSINEALITALTEKLSQAEVVDVSHLTGNTIDFGATVELVDEDSQKEIHYTLLSEMEADPLKNIISVNSPIGKALVGKHVGEFVEIRIPRGTKNYEVVTIKWQNC